MSHTKFNAAFRKSAVLVAEELGLDFIGTKRQVNNGTLFFEDPQTNTRYGLYESGYIRRHIKKPAYYGSIAGSDWEMYPLNRTMKVTESHKSFRGTTSYRTRTARIRILASPDEQLGIMARAVINYRKSNA